MNLGVTTLDPGRSRACPNRMDQRVPAVPSCCANWQYRSTRSRKAGQVLLAPRWARTMTLFPHYFSEEVVPSLAPAPKSAVRRTQEAGGRNDLLGSSRECFIPLAGKVAAHLWLDLQCEMV